jgi:transposase
MTRRQHEPLRALTLDERERLARLRRSRSAPAAQVARAMALLAVADGASFTAAARAVGRRSGDAVGQLVARFNREGLAAVTPRHGGGQRRRYDQSSQERILREVRRTPDRDADRTGTWSLSTLQRALRQAPDGLPGVSTQTIGRVLHEAGFVWGRDRSWCETGTALRLRKRGAVTVVDPDALAKKT